VLICRVNSYLEDNGALGVASGLECGNGGGGGGDIDGWNGVLVVLGVLEERENVITGNAVSLSEGVFGGYHGQYSHAGLAGQNASCSSHDCV
jgi:hypothetical protein